MIESVVFFCKHVLLAVFVQGVSVLGVYVPGGMS